MYTLTIGFFLRSQGIPMFRASFLTRGLIGKQECGKIRKLNKMRKCPYFACLELEFGYTFFLSICFCFQFAQMKYSFKILNQVSLEIKYYGLKFFGKRKIIYFSCCFNCQFSVHFSPFVSFDFLWKGTGVFTTQNEVVSYGLKTCALYLQQWVL